MYNWSEYTRQHGDSVVITLTMSHYIENNDTVIIVVLGQGCSHPVFIAEKGSKRRTEVLQQERSCNFTLIMYSLIEGNN